jgi:hypothetical protein
MDIKMLILNRIFFREINLFRVENFKFVNKHFFVYEIKPPFYMDFEDMFNFLSLDEYYSRIKLIKSGVKYLE